jgi:hypothetical protein
MVVHTQYIRGLFTRAREFAIDPSKNVAKDRLLAAAYRLSALKIVDSNSEGAARLCELADAVDPDLRPRGR